MLSNVGIHPRLSFLFKRTVDNGAIMITLGIMDIETVAVRELNLANTTFK